MKKILLLISAITLVVTSLLAQKRQVVYSNDKDSPSGFVGFAKNGDSIIRIVQVEAEFPGGRNGWRKYLELNLNTAVGDKYIKIPKGDTSAKATVTVNFLVDKNGNIQNPVADSLSSVTVHKKIIAEAIRAIKDGPKWIPAWQDGHYVAYRAKQAITFIVFKN